MTKEIGSNSSDSVSAHVNSCAIWIKVISKSFVNFTCESIKVENRNLRPQTVFANSTRIEPNLDHDELEIKLINMWIDDRQIRRNLYWLTRFKQFNSTRIRRISTGHNWSPLKANMMLKMMHGTLFKHFNRTSSRSKQQTSSSSRSRNLRFHSHVNDGIRIRVSVNGTFAPAGRLLSLGNIYGVLFVTNFERSWVDSKWTAEKNSFISLTWNRAPCLADRSVTSGCSEIPADRWTFTNSS